MDLEQQEHIRQTGYAEAMRYIANAKEMLSKTSIEGKHYIDAKYVSSASWIAYRGVLVALDALAEIKKMPLPKGDERKSILFYRNILKDNQKFQKVLDVVYKKLHLGGYYDGNKDSMYIKAGFENAKQIIDLIKPEGAV